MEWERADLNYGILGLITMAVAMAITITVIILAMWSSSIMITIIAMWLMANVLHEAVTLIIMWLALAIEMQRWLPPTHKEECVAPMVALQVTETLALMHTTSVDGEQIQKLTQP